MDRRATGLHFDEIAEIVGRPDPLVLEFGANNGHSTLMFLGEFPGIEIHCFEPDRRAIKQWRAHIRDKRATLYEAAVGAQTGAATFHMSDGREDAYEGGCNGAGSLRPPISHNHPWLRFERTIEVEVTRFDDWAMQHIPDRIVDFIWTDIQGAEVDLIAGGGEALKNVRWFYTEFNDRAGYVGQIPLATIAERLADDFEIECVFPGDVLFRNKRLEPVSPGLATRSPIVQEGPRSTYRRGPDGHVLKIPPGYSFRSGSDGRLVLVPPGQTYREGKDGRAVPIPPGHHFRAVRDGRMVPIPNGAQIREGQDGRIVPIPLGHTWREGKDGRIVAVGAGDTFRQGSDGRLVALSPKHTWREGEDGRLASQPHGSNHQQEPV